VLHARDVALIATIGVPAHVRLFGSIYTPGSTRGHHPFPLAPIFLVLDFPSFAFLFVIVQFTAKKNVWWCDGATTIVGNCVCNSPEHGYQTLELTR